MKYKVEFHYQPSDRNTPYEEVQDERIEFNGGEFVPIPDVGDTVTATLDGQRKFEVVSRHYLYMDNWCVVEVTVKDFHDPDDDIPAAGPPTILGARRRGQ